MEQQSIEAIVRALNEHKVQYLIVGGLAVVAHGYVRFTADIDLILAFDPANLSRAIGALAILGYQPRAPVPIEAFLDPLNRRKWIEQRNMTVFSLFSPAHPATEIDLFAEPPLDFPAAYARSTTFQIATGVLATFCGLDDLIAMKTIAGRPRDIEDIAQLRKLGGNRKP